MRTKFPNVVAAVEAREQHISRTEGQDLWAVADALVKDVDPVARRDEGKYHDESYEQIGECAKELEKLGYRSYTVGALAHMRNTALAFPKSRRNPAIAFHAHRVAGNPEILDWIAKSAKGKPVSQTYVEEMVGLWQQRHKAKLEAKEKETGVRERPPAKRDLPAPSKEDAPVVLKELSLLRFAREAKKLAAEANRLAAEANDEIDGVMIDVNPNFIAVATETALEAAKGLEEAANAWRTVSNTVRKTSRDKRGHLAVVGG